MNKIPVMIVDDDFLVIQDLKTMVDWSALGFEIVAAATNGKKALSLFRTLQPRLVITDISMPMMDGLDLIENIQRLGGSTCMLILTSYDDFGYAKRAIENNVAGYLLKNEITPDMLEKKLIFIYNKLISDQHIMHLSLQDALNAYFQEDVNKCPDGSPRLSSMAGKEFYFLLFTHRAPLEKNTRRHKNSRSITKQIHEHLLWLDKASCRLPLIFSIGQAVVAGIGNAYGTADSNVPFGQTVRKLHRELKPRLPAGLLAFYYPHPVELSGFKKIYDQVLPHIEFSRHFPSSEIMPMNELLKTPIDTSSSPFNYALLQKHTHDPDVLFEILDGYLKDAFAKRKLHCILSFFSEICTHFQILSQYGLSFEEEYYFDSREDFFSWVKQTYLTCLELLRRSVKKRYSSPVEKTITYMKLNYANPNLSGEKIAECVSLSYGRLGVIFKQEIGKTIIEYLTDLRVEKALQLLKNSNYKIYEIAELVGYNSSQYFSQIIIRKTNKRPLHFRNNLS